MHKNYSGGLKCLTSTEYPLCRWCPLKSDATYGPADRQFAHSPDAKSSPINHRSADLKELTRPPRPFLLLSPRRSPLSLSLLPKSLSRMPPLSKLGFFFGPSQEGIGRVNYWGLKLKKKSSVVDEIRIDWSSQLVVSKIGGDLEKFVMSLLGINRGIDLVSCFVPLCEWHPVLLEL